MRTELSHHLLSKLHQSCHLLVWLDVWFGGILCTHVYIPRRSKIFLSPTFLCNRRDIIWSRYRDVYVWATYSTVTGFDRTA